MVIIQKPTKIMGVVIDEQDTPTDTQVLTFNDATSRWIAADSAGGGIATTSNDGTGEGLALALVGDDAPFKSLKASAAPITISSDADSITYAVDNIAVSVLADATDGELITWDANGAPATVATGNATEVLVSNGAGAAPTFQAQAGGGDALTANPLSQFAATTSLQLLGVMSDETGTGALVFADSPTLITPALGTPASGVLTNATGLPEAGLLDNAVTLAKMAGGTDGNLITYDASGDPAAVATGTAAQVLTSNGVGAAPTFQAAAGGTNSFYIGSGQPTTYTAGADDRFFAFWGGLGGGFSSGSNAEQTIFNALTLTDISFFVQENTRASASTGKIQDDGADISNADTTITASTSGLFETNGLSDVIAADSLCVFLLAIAAASGNFRCISMQIRVTE